MAQRVVVVTSAHTPFDQRIFLKEARSLAAAGYDVTLIVPHDKNEIRDGIQIKAVPRLTGRVQRFTINLWRLYREALRQRGDYYHLHDPELLLVGLALKLTTHAKVIFDAHEDYPSVALRREWIPKPLRGVLRGAAKLVYSCTLPFFDAVVAATEAIADEIPHREKVVVKNYSQLPPEDGGVVREPNLLVYAGVVSEERGISLFLQAFRKMNELLPVRLRLIGVRDDEMITEQILSDCPPGSVEVHGWMPQPEALQLISCGTLGLVLDLFLPGNDGPPTKMFDYMALGLPVVGCNLPTPRRIIDETGCGIVVDLHEPESVAARIVELLQDPSRLAEMRSRGLAACKKYQWSSQAELLIRLYRKLDRNGRNLLHEEVSHVNSGQPL